MEHVQERFLQMQPAMNLAQNEKIKSMQSKKKIYHLGFGQSPFPVPEFAKKALREHAGEATYLPVKGLFETREAICNFHFRLDNFTHFSPDDVIIGPGSKELIFHLVSVVRGDVYLLSPTWTTYKPQAVIAGKKVHILQTLARNQWKLTPSMLEPVVKKATPGSVLIFCNPDNPTGTCYTGKELKELADVLRKSKLIVVCDEIYARLKYSRQHESLVTYLPEQTILSSGISKWASCGGWRFGYHLFPKELRPLLDAVSIIASNSFTCCSAPIQYASRVILKCGEEASEYASHCARILCAIGNFCARSLSKAGVKVNPPQAGYYIFPDFEAYRDTFAARGITTGEQMCDAILKEANVALLAGGPAFLDDPAKFTVRLCFINFNGAAALEASESLGLSTPLSADFVEKYCKETVDAMGAIIHWLENLGGRYAPLAE